MRKVLFWIHLAAGVIAGLVIAVMSFTGAALAFESELVAWAERDARRVAVPAGAEAGRLSLAEMQARVRDAVPELRAPVITVENDPAAAVAFSSGRDPVYYVDPYTGAVRGPASTAMHDFMHVMEQWHRFLGRADEARPLGKAVTAACNLAFFFLAVSGLYLWWPRSWSWRGVRAVAVLNWRLAGRARDFNWHNAIGLWTAPVLLVLTLTAVPISYRWGSNLIYRMVGEEPPAGGPPVAAAPALEITRPTPEARPVGFDAVLTQVQAEHPQWTQVTMRSVTAQRGQRPSVATAPSAPAQSGDRPAPTVGSRPSPDTARSPQPLTFTVRERGSWPRTATTTLSFDPFTGELLRREGFGDLSSGRQIRTWTRFLHTGQALGSGGQLVAGLACVGALFLVYTGLALSWRRFFARRGNVATPAVAVSDVSVRS